MAPRKAPSLTAAEQALVRDALSIPPVLPDLPADGLIARWKAQVAAPAPTTAAFPVPAQDEPLRLAARSGAKISKATAERIRHLLRHGKPKPDGR